MLHLLLLKSPCFQRTMGVFYEVRVHLAENADDFVGKKGTTVSMGIRKVEMLEYFQYLQIPIIARPSTPRWAWSRGAPPRRPRRDSCLAPGNSWWRPVWTERFSTTEKICQFIFLSTTTARNVSKILGSVNIYYFWSSSLWRTHLKGQKTVGHWSLR